MEFITLTMLIILAVLSPGPDFIIVTQNASIYNRSIGIFTAFGIGSGAIVLSLISILGLTLVITKSPLLFGVFKFLSALYLIYLGYKMFQAKKRGHNANQTSENHLQMISHREAFKQGLLCSSLNPKAMCFFTALFTTIFGLNPTMLVKIAYAIEVTFLYFTWFVFLSHLVTRANIKEKLDKIQHVTNKVLGVLLTLLGLHIIMTLPFIEVFLRLK